jgi:hypothetical protein
MNNSGYEYIEAIQQLADVWGMVVTDYGRTHGSTDVRDLPGSAIRWADSRFPFWNCITLTGPVIDSQLLRERLEQAAGYMKGKREAGYIWIFENQLTPDARALLPEAASRVGLAYGLTMHGMAGDILPIPEPFHPSLEFARVDTNERLMAYADINSLAYGLPVEAGRDGLGGSSLWISDMYSYIALENGRPVSVAATVANGDCLFLALVATRPEAHRKGYGEATARKALYEGARASGLTRTVLHATMAGAPVYERIGYHKVGTIQAYTLPK